MDGLYYTPPSDEIFEEVRAKAMELWHEIDSDKDAYGYASEKCSRIREIGNVADNFMYIVAMFDHGNLGKLADRLSYEAREAIRDRMIDGGNPEESIPF